MSEMNSGHYWQPRFVAVGTPSDKVQRDRNRANRYWAAAWVGGVRQ